MTAPKTKLHEAVDILQNARAYLADPNHWHQGSLHSGSMRSCAWGAMMRTTTSGQTLLELQNSYSWRNDGSLHCAPMFLTKAVKKVSRHHSDIVSFNDSSRTSHADIMKAFDVAIADAQKAVAEYEASDPKERDNV